MKKVAIVTDSTCCLPGELVERYDICLVPVLITYKGETYRDGVDMNPSEVYGIMRRRKDLPTTATPSPRDFLDAYCRLSQKAESILCVTLTSVQSGTFNTAVLAKQMAEGTIPNTAIEVIDSRAVAGALGFVVLEAARIASQGAELAHVANAARSMVSKVNFLAMLDTLYYLARTGRVGRAASWVASVLDIKPVVEHATSIGETKPVARSRTRARARERMLGLMAERVGNHTIHAIVHHADELAQGERLKAEIDSRFDCAELYLTEFTPSMGVHCGPGMLAVSFYVD